MATQTVINQTQMTPEQKALAAAELEQLKRRMAFENFAGEILMGFKPGTGNTPTQQPGGVNTVPTGNPTGGGTTQSSALGNALSAAQLNQGLSNPGGGGGSGIGDVLGRYLTPGVLGGMAGLAIGGVGGIRPGSTVGNVIGDALTDMSPEVNRPDATDGTSVPVEPNRPDTTQGTPQTPAQTAAQRAAQTALADSNFQFTSDSMAQENMSRMQNNPGGERYDHLFHSAGNVAAREMMAQIEREGGDITTEESRKRISDYVGAVIKELQDRVNRS